LLYLSLNVPKSGRKRSLEIEKLERINPMRIPPTPIFSTRIGNIGEIIPIPKVTVKSTRDAE